MAAFPPTPLRLPSAFPPRGAAPKRPLNVARGCGAPSGQSRCRHYVSGSGVSFRYAPGDPTALHFAAAIAPTPSRGGAAPCHLRQKAVAPTPLRLSPQGKGGLFVRYRLSPSALLAPDATLLHTGFCSCRGRAAPLHSQNPKYRYPPQRYCVTWLLAEAINEYPLTAITQGGT